jgi:DNA-binding HxlR family transcriptional regulator
MGSSYHQFCPVAKAMELLDERWTMLILRELMVGSEHFNEVRRGVPRMSPTLLSRRLGQLVRAGLLERQSDGGDVRYLLTPAGRELQPVVEAVGAWGVRWMGELGDQDLDPKLLLWDMHRNVDRGTVPPGRTVVQFRFPDLPANLRDWWLLITPEEVDVCDIDPGHPVTVSVTGNLRTLVGIWLGDLTWAATIRSGAVQLEGPQRWRRQLPTWFTLSRFAQVPRPSTVPTSA